jgi:peptidylprolyl isomerase domain and WD repeat-containing protein 1
MKRGADDDDEDDDKTPPRLNADGDDDSDDEPMPMPMPAKPKKRKVLEFERVYIDNLPSAEMYEKSYMHRDVISHVLVTPHTDFIVTASTDGHLKFWKKMKELIEFVKHYRAHLNAIRSLSASSDGLWLCTTASDPAAKFYDVVNFDMVNMIKLSFSPTVSCWIHKKGSPHPKVAIADDNSENISIFNAMSDTAEPTRVVKVHGAPVKVMAYNYVQHTVVSGDTRGILLHPIIGISA